MPHFYPNEDIASQVESLPKTSGIYQFFDGVHCLYIGKANNLRIRVKNYFQKSGDERWFIPYMRERLTEIQILSTRNEKEALILENHLIKKHMPLYNVRLRDDKRYLLIKVDLKHSFPWLETVRKQEEGNPRVQYFGPYTSARYIRQTLKLLNKSFKLRTCSDQEFKRRQTPCLEYHIGRCEAPCVYKIDESKYQTNVANVRKFLEGKFDLLLKDLKKQMLELSEALKFEEAAKIRDIILATEASLKKQLVTNFGKQNTDVISFYGESNVGVLQILSYREAQLEYGEEILIENLSDSFRESCANLLLNFYEESKIFPSKIIVPDSIADSETLELILSEKACRKVEIKQPSGDRERSLLSMAFQNAMQNFYRKKKRLLQDTKAPASLLRLKSLLGLDFMPESIECYDISNLGESAPVASLVKFNGEKPVKKDYRVFHIKNKEKQDDFAMLAETISRRLKNNSSMPEVPDLFLIDGGKGQLAAVLNAVKKLSPELKKPVSIMSLAKKRRAKGTEERLHFENGEILTLFPEDPLFSLMTRLRNEAHRFALENHRKLRKKVSFESEVLSLPGIGPKSYQKLMQSYKGIEGLKKVSFAELEELDFLNKTQAKRLYLFLKKREKNT